MIIEKNKIGKEFPPFIIAEMSGNHNQSLQRALEIVEIAAATGAHALKLQTYTADTMTLDIKNDEFFISDEKNLWKGQSLYDLYKQAYTPWEWHEPIKKLANELYRKYPSQFIPRYNMVSFSSIPYAEVYRRGMVQKEIISNLNIENMDMLLAESLIKEQLEPIN